MMLKNRPMFLSFASIIKAVIEITKVEHKDAYERRMKQGLDKTRG